MFFNAYEVKFDCCLFERLFKVKKNGVLEIFTILYYANEESDDVINSSSLSNKILNQEYLQKYWSSVLQTWQKCASQKKQNDTYYVVAMATLLAPGSFCEKPNIPIYNHLKWDGGFCSEYTWFPFCLSSPYWIVGSI